MIYVDDVRGAIESVDTSDDKGVKMGQMMVALSILEAELLCEQCNWEGLEQAMEVSLVQSPHRLTADGCEH